MNFDSVDTEIPILGEAKIDSPFQGQPGQPARRSFVADSEKITVDVNAARLTKNVKAGKEIAAFELAGPREKIYFDPSKVSCALVTCGGLCPGLNDIVRSIVLELYHGYGVRRIYGIRYGLEGFIPKYGHALMDLKPENVLNIHAMGGTLLGSSRGHQSIAEIVDSLERMNVSLIFMIGGGGTLIAATKIADEISMRGLKIGIVGIPKTIDNDIYLIARSFGFDTAVDVATQSIRGAHNEAEGYHMGIGMIKLMGRYSGFIAATTVLAQQDVNFVLIPEVDFDLEGKNGLLAALEERLKERDHAVIVVAEGAGQKFFKSDRKKQDKSGNIKLQDIGIFLKDAIKDHFSKKKVDVTIKYIDPSYLIRSLAANANDHVFCSFLGRDAVHAGMAGKTKVLIGYWNNHFVNIPMSASAGKRKQVDPKGKLWHSILAATGQGVLINDT
jgi:6-phosphofructokinase 1